MEDSISKPRLAIFFASIISIGVGFFIISSEYIEFGEKQKDINEIYIFDIFDNESIFSFTGEILIKDYFSDRPKTDLKLLINTDLPNNHKFEVFILPESYTSINTSFINKFKEYFGSNVIPLKQISATNFYEGIENNLELNLSEDHHFVILVYNENEELQDHIISSQTIATPNKLEIIQHESAEESIRSSKIIEGLTWTLLGVSGMVFLAQIGLGKDE